MGVSLCSALSSGVLDRVHPLFVSAFSGLYRLLRLTDVVDEKLAFVLVQVSVSVIIRLKRVEELTQGLLLLADVCEELYASCLLEGGGCAWLTVRVHQV